MNQNSKSDHELIQRFVGAAKIVGDAAAGKPVILPSDQPADWIEAVEQRAGLMFPKLYYIFASRYQFPEFDAGGISFFANAPDKDRLEIHLRDKIFQDPTLSRLCLKNGYLQFGNPDASPLYDPICFDTRCRKSRKDCPIVQLDHEEILIHQRIKIVHVIAPTMQQFMQTVIKSAASR